MTTRRHFLKSSAKSVTAVLVGNILTACNNKSNGLSIDNQPATITGLSLLDEIGPLLPPDSNGVMLPTGFTSRIIALSGQPPHNDSPYIWHNAPDGGATFSTSDGGWIYVSNSEVNNMGGVGAIRFDMSGTIISAYSILTNSNHNCAGGATPWNTWLSCEEADTGIIWECDPFGQLQATQRPALGTFPHEAVTVDTQSKYLYMTEDKTDGRLYRFIPTSIDTQGIPDLDNGVVEVAFVDNITNDVSWAELPDPTGLSQPTRYQVPNSTIFNGGEGIVFNNGFISFATKGDDRIWSYDTLLETISIIYDANEQPNPILTGVDNITLSKEGELIVGEDGGNMQAVALTKNNKQIPLLQLIGHDGSEITGPSFSPDGKRFYFSSQRGTINSSDAGVTFEITGPFHS